ncbi:MAG: hypothetical protein JWR18_104 [Segetibacter sp.]|jgi:hypothetical protein|nr:hypothetical protein [Segetibacter sp.]
MPLFFALAGLAWAVPLSGVSTFNMQPGLAHCKPKARVPSLQLLVKRHNNGQRSYDENATYLFPPLLVFFTCNH